MVHKNEFIAALGAVAESDATSVREGIAAIQTSQCRCDH
jgi:hypothetical protein